MLTKEEAKYLQLKFQGADTKTISKLLNIDRAEDTKMRNRVFEKLEVNNWFNAYRKAFHVLDNDLYLSQALDAEINKCVKKIKNIDVQHGYIDAEKRAAIYSELLEFYSALKFNYIYSHYLNNKAM